MRNINRHRHKRWRFIARITKHHALVTCADSIVLIKRVCTFRTCSMLNFVRFVNAKRNIRTLFVNGIHNAARMGIETVFSAIVANFINDAAHNFWNINISLRAHFAANNHKSSRDKRFTCAAKQCWICRSAIRGNITCTGKVDFFCQNGVKDCIGNLVAHFIGVTFSNRFGRK